MKQVQIGGRMPASAICLGCMRMAGMEVERAERIVCAALERGVNMFDHADIYAGGEAEALFGRVLKRNPGLRERVVVQSKCGIRKGVCYDFSRRHILEAVDGSLQRLGVETLDVLLLHRPDALMEPEEVASALESLRAAGKARFFGVSNHNPQQIELLRKFLPFPLVANQLQFGLAHTILVDEGINVNVHAPHAVVRDGGALDYCRLHDITIQAWSPFQFGRFEGVFLQSDKYAALNAAVRELAEEKGVGDAAIAVAWILRHPARMQAVVGTMNERRLQDICDADTVDLTREEWYRLYRAAGNPLP